MKYLQKKNPRHLWPILVAVLLVCIIGGLIAASLLAEDPPVETQPSAVTEPSESLSGSEASTEPLKPLSMPYALEDGKILVESLFQFSGLNPDHGDEEAENVAAIQLLNESGQHIQSLTLTVVTAEGTTAVFTASDIPAGRGAMVVSGENVPLETNPDCIRITCDVVYAPETPVQPQLLSVSVQGTQITLENLSGSDLSCVTVYYHSMLDTYCYGGTPYSYTIDSISAGATADISAWDCYLGELEVVRVEIGAE